MCEFFSEDSDSSHPKDRRATNGAPRVTDVRDVKLVSITNALASVAVKDLESAVTWYESIFNRPPSRPMAEVAEWSFERGGWLQVYQLPERAGSGSFTLAVTSVEDQIAQLDKLNIDTSQRTHGDRVKTVMISDPDGNHIAFAEAIDPNLAH